MTDNKIIRSPICTVLGHVDHGKSSLLDKIRGTAIVDTEAGKITQAIGASIIPLNVIIENCKSLLQQNQKFTIPGLLFIDTPGHEAFNSLRKRGGNLADIAIVVIDINEGFKPQTIETIEILKASKTPFVIAANKVDLIHGWRTDTQVSILDNISKQAPEVAQKFETKMYELVGKLSEKFNINAERFDRVDDYTKQIAIVPTSAITGEGIPALLMIMIGLTQKFLEQTLKIDVTGDAKAVILEIKESKGLGLTMDVIIYDGSLKRGDTIAIGGIDNPITTKIRGLFQPEALHEMRDKKSKFKQVNEVFAATAVKILANDIENVMAGMPLESANKQSIEQASENVQADINQVITETDQDGLIIKADTIGSLEAVMFLLKQKNIPIRRAAIGNINKKDMTDCEGMYEKDVFKSVILGFNVIDDSKMCNDKVKIITNNVIYKIIEDYEKWVETEKKNQEQKELDVLIRPAKIEILTGYVFRQNNPAVCGVHILEGKLKTGTPLMKNGPVLTEIKAMQSEKENVSVGERGKEISISMPNITIGRQIQEGDILYSAIPEADYIKMKKLKKLLTLGEKELLREISIIMRKDNPVWGVG